MTTINADVTAHAGRPDLDVQRAITHATSTRADVSLRTCDVGLFKDLYRLLIREQGPQDVPTMADAIKRGSCAFAGDGWAVTLTCSRAA